MIVFRFDDPVTIGNHVRNMPCGSPCRFVISKCGDSSGTSLLVELVFDANGGYANIKGARYIQ